MFSQFLSTHHNQCRQPFQRECTIHIFLYFYVCLKIWRHYTTFKILKPSLTAQALIRGLWLDSQHFGFLLNDVLKGQKLTLTPECFYVQGHYTNLSNTIQVANDNEKKTTATSVPESALALRYSSSQRKVLAKIWAWRSTVHLAGKTKSACFLMQTHCTQGRC